MRVPTLGLDQRGVVDASFGKCAAAHFDLLFCFSMATCVFEELEKGEATLRVRRLEPNQVTRERECALRVVCESGNRFGEDADAKLAAVAAGGGQPRSEVVEVGELEAFEEVALEEVGKLAERFGVEGLQACTGRADAV
jgi:hypothetical protein